MSKFKIPSIPPPLEGGRTCVYKRVDGTAIELDFYLPRSIADPSHRIPVLIFIHGGAWIGGHRTEYCRPLFEEFLSHGFIVTSIDYRLLPESDFIHGQLEDIADIEKWVQNELPMQLKQHNIYITVGDIVVAGASAGALLALLTPKLWTCRPTAILSIYGPTNMHHLPYVAKGPLAVLDLSCPDSQMLRSSTNFEHPPTNTPIPSSAAEWLSDRTKIGIYMFRTEATVDFLLRGLIKPICREGKLIFPSRGQVSKEEIDMISPLQLCCELQYPPVYQIMGSDDSVFDTSHVTSLAAALQEQGVPHAEHIIQGADHAFDMAAKSGDSTHHEVIAPAVNWVGQFVSYDGEKKG